MSLLFFSFLSVSFIATHEGDVIDHDKKKHVEKKKRKEGQICRQITEYSNKGKEREEARTTTF